MKKIIIIALIASTLFSCSNDAKQNNAEYKAPTIAYTGTADSITTVASVNKLHSFLQDYKSNYAEINSIKFIIEGAEEANKVDFEKLITYQEDLKKSGYFTESYFEEKMIYYTELDSRLSTRTPYSDSEIKQDPILFTADHQKILNNIDNLTYTAKQTRNGVLITGTYENIVVTAELFFQNDTWKINNMYCYFN